MKPLSGPPPAAEIPLVPLGIPPACVLGAAPLLLPTTACAEALPPCEAAGDKAAVSLLCAGLLLGLGTELPFANALLAFAWAKALLEAFAACGAADVAWAWAKALSLAFASAKALLTFA